MKLRIVILCFAILCGGFSMASFAQSDTLHSVSDTNVPKKNSKKGSSHSRATFVDAENVEHVHTTDSVLRKKHNPKIAIALSAVVPGAGQIYNRKAWKVPIIYAGLAASGYCVYHFAKQTNQYKSVYEVQQIIDSLKQRNMGILITDHNVRETLSSVDRAYIMADGEICCEGSSSFLVNDPKAREVYLGSRFTM